MFHAQICTQFALDGTISIPLENQGALKFFHLSLDRYRNLLEVLHVLKNNLPFHAMPSILWTNSKRFFKVKYLTSVLS